MILDGATGGRGTSDSRDVRLRCSLPGEPRGLRHADTGDTGCVPELGARAQPVGERTIPTRCGAGHFEHLSAFSFAARALLTHAPMASQSLFKGFRAILCCLPFVLGVAATGCGDDEAEITEDNCSAVCNRWADCGHPNLDVDNCIDNCTDAIDDADVDTCNDCLLDLTCTSGSAECDNDCDFIVE